MRSLRKQTDRSGQATPLCCSAQVSPPSAECQMTPRSPTAHPCRLPTNCTSCRLASSSAGEASRVAASGTALRTGGAAAAPELGRMPLMTRADVSASLEHRAIRIRELGAENVVPLGLTPIAAQLSGERRHLQKNSIMQRRTGAKNPDLGRSASRCPSAPGAPSIASLRLCVILIEKSTGPSRLYGFSARSSLAGKGPPRFRWTFSRNARFQEGRSPICSWCVFRAFAISRA